MIPLFQLWLRGLSYASIRQLREFFLIKVACVQIDEALENLRSVPLSVDMIERSRLDLSLSRAAGIANDNLTSIREATAEKSRCGLLHAEHSLRVPSCKSSSRCALRFSASRFRALRHIIRAASGTSFDEAGEIPARALEDFREMNSY